ncbi:hypothetical protein H0H93_011871, partial [Arthromyces matolae]
LGPHPRNVEILYSRSDTSEQIQSGLEQLELNPTPSFSATDRDIEARLSHLTLPNLHFLLSVDKSLYRMMVQYIAGGSTVWLNLDPNQHIRANQGKWEAALTLVEAVKNRKECRTEDPALAAKQNSDIREAAIAMGSFGFQKT